VRPLVGLPSLSGRTTVSLAWGQQAPMTPLMKSSVTERALQRRRGVLGGLRRAALLPILPEWAA
jgi:hypothetical protein